MDSTLIGNLMTSVSFYANTTIYIIAGLVAALGCAPKTRHSRPSRRKRRPGKTSRRKRGGAERACPHIAIAGRRKANRAGRPGAASFLMPDWPRDAHGISVKTRLHAAGALFYSGIPSTEA
jgi:hypothetical protein